jgi:hypothetical protein
MWIMAVMDGAIANVALPTIAQDLHASPAFSIWIVNGYQPAITISLLPPAAEAHSNLAALSSERGYLPRAAQTDSEILGTMLGGRQEMTPRGRPL